MNRASSGGGTREEVGQEAEPRSSALRRAAMALEAGGDVGDGQRLAGRSLSGEQLGRGVAEVRVAQVRGAQAVLVGAARRREGRALLDPAEAEPGRRDRERRPAKKAAAAARSAAGSARR